ncbi:MAG: MarR family transcriptional regulator [Planctomycetota bacterium]
MEDSRSLEIEDRIVAAIRQIIRAVDLHSRRIEESCGLTGPQLAALNAVAKTGPLSAGALAKAISLSQPTVTGIVTRLENRGLLQRRRSETDRRSVEVGITGAGDEVLRQAPSLLQDQFSERLAQLEEWERTQILATLQRIATMMGAESLADAAPHLLTGPVDREPEG